MNLRELNQPKHDPAQPAFLITRSTAEFDDVLRRATEGQFRITVLESMRTRSGNDNAVWKFHISSNYDKH